MNIKKDLKRNIRLFYATDIVLGLEFAIPIWVAFHLKFLNFTEIALLHSFQYALSTFLELPTGAFADLVGRRVSMIIGYAFQALGFLTLVFSTNLEMFFFSYLLGGVGMALVSGSNIAMAYDTFKELGREADFSKFVAKTSFLFRISLVIGTLLGGYIYLIDYRLPYLLEMVTFLIAISFIYFQIEPTIDSEKFSIRSYIAQTILGFKEIVKTTKLKYLSVYYFLVGGITWSCAAYFNQPFAKDLGFDEIEQSLLFSAIYLISSVTIYLITKNDQAISRKVVYFAFPIILGLGLLPGIFATKFMAFFMLFLILFATSCRFAFLDRYTNEEFESKYRATAVSALNMLVSLFFIIVVGISGVFQDIFGTQVIFSFLGLITVLILFPLGYKLANLSH